MSSSEEYSSFGGSSEEEEEVKFNKKVVFRKSVKKELKKEENLHDIANAVITKNLNLQATATSTSGFKSEADLVIYLDDTDGKPGDYELWKQREFARLHRDRNLRISKE